MSFLLLHRGTASGLLSDDPVVPAADIPRLHGTLELLQRSDRCLQDARAEAATLTDGARSAGFQEGLRRGEERATAQLTARLFELEVKAAALRSNQRSEAARLAIEIVRRVAGEFGPEATVAALAEKAVADLAPETKVVVKVSAASRAAVAERLADNEMITVMADPALADDDCVVETSFGVVRAGLETQLAAIERTWTSSAGDV